MIKEEEEWIKGDEVGNKEEEVTIEEERIKEDCKK